MQPFGPGNLGVAQNHRTFSARPGNRLNSYFPMSSYGNTKPLTTQGTFTADITSIDTGIT